MLFLGRWPWSARYTTDVLKVAKKHSETKLWRPGRAKNVKIEVHLYSPVHKYILKLDFFNRNFDGKNRNYGQKTEILVKNRNSGKIKILVKNRNSAEK